MSSKTIFTQTHAPRTNRLVDGFDSAVYSNLAIGKIQGQYRTLPALMSPLATDDDVWHIVNLQAAGQNGLNVYDAVAVLGAASGKQAKEWALQQHGQFYDAIATDVQQTSSQGLMRHLANRHYHAYQSPVRANDLAAMQDLVTGQQVQWDGIELKSHSGQTGIMLVDMIKHDDHHLLLDAMDRDGLTELLASIGAEFAHYDALIVEKHNLDRLMSRLSTSMAKASEAGVSIAKVTQSEPFKKNKVTQIAVLFEMSDGQSVAIVFHNPDTTPSQLLPKDTLISWKWMLNGRDVSAAIQPNQGEDVKLPVLATRIMKLVNQNSARFKRQQATKAKTQQELDEARKRLGEQVEEIAALDGEMAEIQKQIDTAYQNTVKLLQNPQEEIVKLLELAAVPNTNNLYSKTFKNEFGSVNLSVSVLTAELDIALSVMDSDAKEIVENKVFTFEQLEAGAMDDAKSFAQSLSQKFNMEKARLEESGNGASVNPISQSEAIQLIVDLKNLNADPEWSGGNSERYNQFYKRILSAQEGVTEDVTWAKEWLADLETKEAEAFKLEQERLAAQEAEAHQREAALQQAHEAGTADNPIYQAWLNTLENPADAKNHEFMAWVSERDAEFKQQWTGEVPATPDQNSEYALARISYFQQWAADHLADRLRVDNPINPDQEFLQNIINGTVDATTVDMDFIIELAEKYQDDEAMNALVEQALEIINQAEQAAAQLVA